MSNVTTATGPLNLWSSNSNSTLTGTNFNDILHAIDNNTKMKGGLGKDHFHVDARKVIDLGSPVTGTQILDFNATQSDRLVLDGITDFDASKIMVRMNGDDYDVYYDQRVVATVNLQYTNAQGQVVDWNPDLDQATAAITKMVRAGQADPLSEYYYGTDAAQTFRPLKGRTNNIVNFDPTKDFIDMSSLKEFLRFKSIPSYANTKILGEGDNRYIAVNVTGSDHLKVYLKPNQLNDDNLKTTANLIITGYGGTNLIS